MPESVDVVSPPLSGGGRIDTHQHVIPPFYREILADAGVASGGFPVPPWRQETSLAVMDTHEIATAILSVSTPGAHLGADGPARTLARRLNEYSAELVKDRPDRFGFFATLTLPDVDGAIKEAAYALDVLGADGVVLLANAQGIYLGDPRFATLIDELGRRGAVVFVHPHQLDSAPVPGVPPYIADFLLDTTRTAVSLARSGVLTRYPDLKIILAHGGGFLPYAAYRIAGIIDSPDDMPRGNQQVGIEILSRFYFDLALSASPASLPSLLAFADPTRITFGTDFPYAPLSSMVKSLPAPIPDDLRHAIGRGNAEALFPRLAPVPAAAR